MTIHRIDPQAHTGGDGSESAPYRLKSEAHAVCANGDSLLWKRGSRTIDYPAGDTFTSFTGLTFGAYPDSNDPKPVLNIVNTSYAHLYLVGCKDCTVQDLSFSYGLYGVRARDCYGITVRRCDALHAYPYYGVYFDDASGLVEDCQFGLPGVVNSGPYYNAIAKISDGWNSASGEMLVRRCKFYSCGGHGSATYYKGAVWARGTGDAGQVFVDDCEFHDSEHAALVMSGGVTDDNPKVTATRCLFANSLNASIVSYATGSNTTSGEAIIANSIFVGPESGTTTYDILNSAEESTGFTVKLLNNTMLARRNNHQHVRWSATLDSVDMYNNVLIVPDAYAGGLYIADLTADSSMPRLTADGNHYYIDSGSTTDRFYAATGGAVDFATYQSNTGEDANGAIGTDVVVNASIDDFSGVVTDQLLARNDAESPAVGGGKNLWADGVITDKRLLRGFHGEIRPSVGAWDAGAFDEAGLMEVL